MAYSSSIKAILRVKEHLDLLADAKTNIEWKVSNPSKFAYYLREAFSVAHTLKEQYPRYANLKIKFTIRVGKKMVMAQLKEVLDIEPLALGKLTIANAVSAMGVVGAALLHKAPLMHFPNANLEGEELEKVRKWSDVSDYLCETTLDNGIVLSKK